MPDVFLVDLIILVCNGCQAERRYDLSAAPLRSAQELIAWMKSKPTPCGCGASTCDVKARMAKPS